MQAHLFDVVVLDYGSYEFDDRSTPYVVIFGGGTANLQLTVDPELSESARVPAMTRADLVVEVSTDVKVTTDAKTGRSRALPPVAKLRVLSMAPAAAPAKNAGPLPGADKVKTASAA